MTTKQSPKDKANIKSKSSASQLLSFLNYYITYPIALTLISYSFYLISFKYVDYQFIDEIFHIPQAQKYCNGDFHHWDSKITTPPGLYVLAYLYEKLLSFLPIDTVECDIPTLRSLNTIGGTIILPLCVTIPIARRYPTRLWISNVVLIPLITIYLNLFYTEVWSTIFILSSFTVSYLCPFGVKSSMLSSLLVFSSLWFRQTNIVWSAFNLVIGIDQKIRLENYTVEKFETKYQSLSKYLQFLKSWKVYSMIMEILVFMDTALGNILAIIPFLVNFVLFGVFLLYNQGITFGDKENHVSTIHFSQIYYCFLFMGFCGWPLILSRKSLAGYLQFSFGSMGKIIGTAMIYTMMAYTIKHFTVVHPFLLADNRHYTFYLWRKVIDSGTYSRYAMIPIYHFLMVLMLTQFAKGHRSTTNVVLVLGYMFCLFATIIPSPLFEPRYYILPYLYWRLLTDAGSVDDTLELFGWKFSGEQEILAKLGAEFIWNLVVNLAMLFVFINFEFSWDSEPEVIQRIIW